MFFIRKANPEDYADIATIHFKSWHAAYLGLLPASYINDKNTLCKKKKMWQGLMAHPDVSVWIAYDAHHNNLGFIGYFTNHKDYEITTLYVLPDYQGLGIGTQLMTASLQALLESHINAHFSLWVLEAIVCFARLSRIGYRYSINDSIITSPLRISYQCPFFFMGIRS
ncbi:GNAT family N-acetyltransferase [Psychrobacter aquimaris]|uniref:GNAT family N-acetyltransferase n=1 Tax=Psychrobacter aquimaris TaxID=292733 RepID=UPI003FD567A1